MALAMGKTWSLSQSWTLDFSVAFTVKGPCLLSVTLALGLQLPLPVPSLMASPRGLWRRETSNPSHPCLPFWKASRILCTQPSTSSSSPKLLDVLMSW